MKPLEFLERLKQTRMGTAILREADEVNERAAKRAEDVKEYARVTAERMELLPAFVAEEQRIMKESMEAIFAANRQVLAVQAQRQDFDYRTAGQLRRLEQRLRDSCDARIAPGGPVLQALALARSHVAHHNLSNGTTPPRVLQERIRDLRDADDDQAPAHIQMLEQRLALANTAAPIEQALDRALGRVSELQVTGEGDIGPKLREVLAQLPDRCGCGVSLAFLRCADVPASEMPPEARQALVALSSAAPHGSPGKAA